MEIFINSKGGTLHECFSKSSLTAYAETDPPWMWQAMRQVNDQISVVTNIEDVVPSIEKVASSIENVGTQVLDTKLLSKFMALENWGPTIFTHLSKLGSKTIIFNELFSRIVQRGASWKDFEDNFNERPTCLTTYPKLTALPLEYAHKHLNSNKKVQETRKMHMTFIKERPIP